MFTTPFNFGADLKKQNDVCMNGTDRTAKLCCSKIKI
jgi:hypothetical protein